MNNLLYLDFTKFLFLKEVPLILISEVKEIIGRARRMTATSLAPTIKSGCPLLSTSTLPRSDWPKFCIFPEKKIRIALFKLQKSSSEKKNQPVNIDF